MPGVSFFLDALKNDLTATSPGHDVVAVALMSSIPHDPASTSRPRARHPIRPCFRIQPHPFLFVPPSLIPTCRQCLHELNRSPLSVAASIGCLAPFLVSILPFPNEVGPRVLALGLITYCFKTQLAATARNQANKSKHEKHQSRRLRNTKHFKSRCSCAKH